MNQYDGGPHEANFLKLDCSKLKYTFGWKPRWNVEQTMDKLVEWYFNYSCGMSVNKCMEAQINDYVD